MASRDRIILATRNPYKLREVRDIFRTGGWDFDLSGLDDFPDAPQAPETGATFAANAAAKARAAAEHTGLIAVADDSGLAVDALGGQPGVLSNRFAGPGGDDAARIAKLLGMVREVPAPRRTARFRCAAAVAAPGEDVVVVEGVCEGVIASAARGEGGFGYDPVFVPLGRDRTMAELTAAEKNRVSHRGRAFRAAAVLLAEMTRGEATPPRAE